MDRKTLLGLLLIGAILVGWFIIMQPSKEERERQKIALQHERDSIAKAEKEKRSLDSIAELKAADTTQAAILVQDSAFANLPDSIRKFRTDSVEKLQLSGKFGPFAPETTEETFITAENDKFLLTFSSKGGQLVSAKLKGYHTYKKRYIEKVEDTLDIIDGDASGYNMVISAAGKNINTSDLNFKLESAPVKITGETQETLRMRAYVNGDSSRFIEYLYTIKGNSGMIGFDIRFQNLAEVIDPNLRAFPFEWSVKAPSHERDPKEERTRSNIYYKEATGDIGRVKRGGGAGEKELKTELKWVSFKQQFFSTALIANDKFTSWPFRISSKSTENGTHTMDYTAALAVPYNYTKSETFGMQMYLGPNHFNTLKKFKLDLEDQIDLGVVFIFSWVNKYLVIPVFNFFDSMHLGYGIIILLLTIIIKLILSPVTYKTFVSSAKMRILKPEVDELSKKFKPDEAIQKQQAVMQLYRRAGVSPLAGCIPALLQMPILLAMFSFFPAAIELRQESFLWAEDLSTYDAIITWSKPIYIFSWNVMGGHISLFTVLMTITTIIYTGMSSSQMNTGGAQAKQMKIMMYLMPIVFLGVLNDYSAALSYYYFLSNVISILLTLIIRQFFINEDKLRAVIEENKKRPAKTSKWQQRLMDAQKQREQQVRNSRGGNAAKGKKK